MIDYTLICIPHARDILLPSIKSALHDGLHVYVNGSRLFYCPICNLYYEMGFARYPWLKSNVEQCVFCCRASFVPVQNKFPRNINGTFGSRASFPKFRPKLMW